MVTKSYCPLAFNYIYADLGGRYKLCCHSSQHPSFKKYDGALPFVFFFSPEMETIRNSMLAGEYVKGCEYCYDTEKNGFLSYRQKLLNNNILTDIEYNSVDISLKLFGSTCNLSCIMCYPRASSTKADELTKIRTDIFKFEDDYIPNANIDSVQMDHIINHIQYVKEIHIYGGEPFLMKSNWDFLDMIKDEYKSNITVIIQTNLTKLDHKQQLIHDYSLKFKSFKLQASIDHYGEKLAYLRYPINVEQLENNLKKYRSYVRGITLTVSILNVQEIEEIINYYCDKYQFEMSDIFLNCVVKPTSMSPKNLTNDIKIELLNRYKNNKKLHIDSSLFVELSKDRCEHDFNKFKHYVKSLDQLRKTNANEIFGWQIY